MASTGLPETRKQGNGPRLDVVALTKLKPQDKAKLLRNLFQDLGLHMDCRQLGCGRLPPSHEYAMLFSGSPVLSLAWHNFLVQARTKEEAKSVRKNLAAADVLKGVSLKKQGEEERQSRIRHVQARLKGLEENVRDKQKLVSDLYLESQRKAAKSGKATTNDLKQDDRRGDAHAKDILLSHFNASNRNLADETLAPLAAALQRLTSQTAKAAEATEQPATDWNQNQTTMANELKTLTSLTEKILDSACDMELEKKPEKTDPRQRLSSFSLWPSLHQLGQSHSRASIMTALEGEAQAATRRLQQQIDEEDLKREAELLSFSIDESGVLKDESDLANLERLKKKQNSFRQEMKTKLLEHRAETKSCEKQIQETKKEYLGMKNELRARLSQKGSDAEAVMKEVDAACLAKASQAQLTCLQAELKDLQTQVQEKRARDSTSQQKKETLQKYESLMKLRQNTIAALARRLKATRERILEERRKSLTAFDETAVQCIATDIANKTEALDGFVRQEAEALRKINFQALPFHHESKQVRVVDLPIYTTTFDGRFASKLNQEVARRLSQRLSIPHGRLVWSHVVQTLKARQHHLEEQKSNFQKRPTRKPTEETLDLKASYEADKAAAAAAVQTGLSDTKAQIHESLENCLTLQTMAQSFEDKGGFYVLPEMQVDGKNLAEWRAEFVALLTEVRRLQHDRDRRRGAASADQNDTNAILAAFDSTVDMSTYLKPL